MNWILRLGWGHARSTHTWSCAHAYISLCQSPMNMMCVRMREPLPRLEQWWQRRLDLQVPSFYEWKVTTWDVKSRPSHEICSEREHTQSFWAWLLPFPSDVISDARKMPPRHIAWSIECLAGPGRFSIINWQAGIMHAQNSSITSFVNLTRRSVICMPDSRDLNMICISIPWIGNPKMRTCPITSYENCFCVYNSGILYPKAD